MLDTRKEKGATGLGMVLTRKKIVKKKVMREERDKVGKIVVLTKKKALCFKLHSAHQANGLIKKNVVRIRSA